ncbi:uncharacterized protein LOC114305596 [Camellia sinensis]|uniref:uncharacterized protein LOC114305596 n=1 Tax=Camellia sinensis TaxID=4442 RepID=UPI001036ED57|nr:uncharacterized protein LOC114305596 [Camellia sinensis]
MGITEAADRIALAVFELDDGADHWWELIKNTRDVASLSWNQFRELFLNKYFPSTIRQERVKEFQNLEQGNMTMTQYVAKFEELARYATRYVANDEEKARMFEWGLDLKIKGRILPQRLPSYAEVLETTLESESEVNDARKASNKRKGSQVSIGPQRNPKGSMTSKPHSRPQPQQQRQQPQQQIQRGGYQQRLMGQIQCFHCQQLGHKKSECPQLPPSRYQGGGSGANTQSLGGQKPWTNKTGSTGQQHQKSKGTQNAKTSGNQKATGKIFALQEEEADPSVIEGNLVLYNSWVHVLFDTGASHSFISFACVKLLELVCEPLATALSVMSPMEGCVQDFDIILGMDWLSTHRAVIDCCQKKVVAHMQNGTRFLFKGDRQDPMVSTKHRMQWHDQLAGRIASLILNEKGQGEIELPRVVYEYADVFPTELPGLPPTREVDFSIELQLGTTPISMAPYRMHQQNYEN